MRVASIASIAAAVALAAGCGSRSDEASPGPSPADPASAAAEPAPIAQPSPTAAGLPAPPLDAAPTVRLEAAPVAQAVDAATRAVKRCEAGAEEKLGTRSLAYAAVARGRTVARKAPRGKAIEVFERLNVNGYPTVFGVLGVVSDEQCEPVWYRVQLPIRPNGAVGYLSARDVEVVEVRTRIEIDLSERRLELFRDGELVYRFTTAIGTEATPTPVGRYYVNQRLVPGDPNGPWGPAALGISAFSPVLVDWEQGGPIAIHGTNNPASIGKAASNGCLRVENDELARLYEETPAGTPVVIVA